MIFTSTARITETALCSLLNDSEKARVKLSAIAMRKKKIATAIPFFREGLRPQSKIVATRAQSSAESSETPKAI